MSVSPGGARLRRRVEQLQQRAARQDEQTDGDGDAGETTTQTSAQDIAERFRGGETAPGGTRTGERVSPTDGTEPSPGEVDMGDGGGDGDGGGGPRAPSPPEPEPRSPTPGGSDPDPSEVISDATGGGGGGDEPTDQQPTDELRPQTETVGTGVERTEQELGYDPTSPGQTFRATGEVPDRLVTDPGIRQQARQLEQQIARRTGFSPEDISINLVREGGELSLQGQISEQARRERLRQQAQGEFQEQFGEGLMPGEARRLAEATGMTVGDIVDRRTVSPGEIQIEKTSTGDLQATLGEEQAAVERGQAKTEATIERRQRVAEALEQQTGEPVDVSDIKVGEAEAGPRAPIVVRGEEGIQAKLDPERRQEIERELATERAQEQGFDVSAEDFVRRDGELRLSAEARERIAAEQIKTQAGRDVITALTGGVAPGQQRLGEVVSPETARAFSGLERGREFTVKAQEEGVAVDTTETFREQSVAAQLGLPSEIVEEGEDFRVTDTGEIELTPEGRQAAITSRLVEQGEVTVRQPSTEVPLGGLPGVPEQIGGRERTIKIETQEQLEFNEQGQLVSVSEAPTTEAERQRAQERLANTISLGDPVTGFLGESVSSFAFGSREMLQELGDISTDVGATLSEGVRIRELGGVQVGLEPAAEVAGDVGALFIEGQLDSQPLSLSPREERAIGDILRGPEEEVTTSPGEAATEEVAGGAASLVRVAVESPQLAATGAETIGEAGAFAVENPLEESVTAAGGTALTAAEGIAQQTIENPLRTGGQLLGSAAIFRAASTIGPRTGAAARYAIQPGEELLGYGGFGLTRRIAGERTAQRLFPQREPLLFSEEAAIRGARRVGGGLRRAVGRLRLSARPGAGLGGLEIETETGGEGQSEVTGEIAGTEPSPGTLPGNEGAGVDATEDPSFGDPWPDYMLPEGHPLRSDTGVEPADTELSGRSVVEAERRRLETAQQPTTGEDEAVGVGVVTDLPPSVDTRSRTERGPLDRLRSAQESRVMTDTDLRTGADVRADVDTDLSTELDVLTETETDTKTETEQRLETETDTETETEIEPEIEIEPDTETEIERFDRWDDDLTVDLPSGTDLAKEFELGVATPEEVLSGNIDGQS